MQFTTETEAYAAYDEMLDEVCGPKTIGVLSFDASTILKECDPIAYRVGFHEWLDSEGIDSDDLA